MLWVHWALKTHAKNCFMDRTAYMCAYVTAGLRYESCEVQFASVQWLIKFNGGKSSGSVPDESICVDLVKLAIRQEFEFPSFDAAKDNFSIPNHDHLTSVWNLFDAIKQLYNEDNIVTDVMFEGLNYSRNIYVYV